MLRSAQALVDNLWITRSCVDYTLILQFDTLAQGTFIFALQFGTLAQGALEKLNENHSHLEIVTQLSQKRY